MLPWLRTAIPLIFSLCLLLNAAALAQTAPPEIKARAAVLMDARTGQVLYQRNPHTSLAPASTTKIMTAILAIESNRLDEKATVSGNAAATEGSTAHLKEGQVVTIRELLNGLMLRSGNDCAVAIAEHIAGSVDAFVVMMNDKAAALGANGTHFVNPNGLPSPQHWSTAYDLAWITRYAMNDQTFADIVNTKQTSLDWQDSDGQEYERSIKNTNKLLWMLEEADGVKTGTTKEAGPCLVASASRDGQRLITVTLHDPARWQDSSNLLQWGFANFTLYEHGKAGESLGAMPVQNGIVNAVDAILATDAVIVVDRAQAKNVDVRINAPDKTKAPVFQGQKLGEIVFTVNDEIVKSFDITAAATVEERTWTRLLLHKLTGLFRLFADWGLF